MFWCVCLYSVFNSFFSVGWCSTKALLHRFYGGYRDNNDDCKPSTLHNDLAQKYYGLSKKHLFKAKNKKALGESLGGAFQYFILSFSTKPAVKYRR